MQTTNVGILEWFDIGEYAKVKRVLSDLRRLDVSHLRTGLSWAEWDTPVGRRWIQDLIPMLASEVEVLPSLAFTPPRLGIQAATNSPPRDLLEYARFTSEVLETLGKYFRHVEFWNEHNYPSDWMRDVDPDGRLFAEMVKPASALAKQFGVSTVLGGMNKVDLSWFGSLCGYGILEHIDVVGIHGLRGTSSEKETPLPWPQRIRQLTDEMLCWGSVKPVWITEAGYSTWNTDDPTVYETQVDVFLEAISSGAERVYWYALYDMPETRKSLRELTEGVHDKHQYHFGLINSFGEPKTLYDLWSRYGVESIAEQTVSSAR